MERQSPDLTTQESLRYRAETEHDDNNAKKNLQDCATTDRLLVLCRGKWRACATH